MARLGPSTPQWTSSLKVLPVLKEVDIEHWASQSRIPKAVHTKGYGNFIESYVHDVEVRTVIDGCCVRAKCFKSMKKNDQPHSLSLKLSSHDASIASGVQIAESLCSCKAGKGDCNHILGQRCPHAKNLTLVNRETMFHTGLLYLLHHYSKCGFKTVPTVTSKTSQKQTWHIPARTDGIKPKKAQDIGIRKISSSISIDGSLIKPATSTKRARIEGIHSTFYNPVSVPLPCTDFLTSLSSRLNTSNSDAQIRLCLSNTNLNALQMVDSKLGFVPKGCVLSYQQSLDDSVDATNIVQNHPTVTDFPSFPCPHLSSNLAFVLTHSQQDVFDGMQVTLTESNDIELKTRDQASNSMWHKLKSKRLTSSIFKRIISRQGDFLKLAESLFNVKKITTAAMRYGIEHEGEAAAKYVSISGNNVYASGLVINPSCSYLGCSPDRKVYDPSADPPYGLLEIKCPSSVNSICDVKCLKLDKQTYKLRQSHDYFFQVMGQMAITGLTWCDFFIMCKDDYHLERVHFSHNKWIDMKDKLDIFYFEHYLPYVSTCK